MKCFSILSIALFLTFGGLLAQNIEFNARINQFTGEEGDTEYLSHNDNHYFRFDSLGRLSSIQNRYTSNLDLIEMGIKNTEVIDFSYAADGQLKGDQSYYVDSVGNKYFVGDTHYKIVDGLCLEERSEVGVDSFYSIKLFEYDPKGRVTQAAFLRPNLEYTEGQIIIDYEKFDTVLYRYDWRSDANCQLSFGKSSTVFFNRDGNTIKAMKSEEGEWKSELTLVYDEMGRVDSIFNFDNGNYHFDNGNYYFKTREKINVTYNEWGGIYSFQIFNQPQGKKIDPIVRNAHTVIWRVNELFFKKGGVEKANRYIIEKVVPALKEYELVLSSI